MRVALQTMLGVLTCCVLIENIGTAQLSSVSAAAGSPTEIVGGGRVVLVPTPAGATPAPAAGGSQSAAGQTRLERLKKLTYDRRPAAILKVWSTLEPKPVEVETPAAATSTTPAVAVEPGATTPVATPDEQPASTDKPADAATDQPAESTTNTPATATTDTAAADAAKAAEAAAAATAALDRELTALQRHVTLSRWNEVKTYLAGLTADEGKAGYEQLLKSLSTTPAGSGSPSNPDEMVSRSSAVREQHVFELNDVIALADVCPTDLDKPSITSLATILRQAQQSGLQTEAIITRLKSEAEVPAESAILSRQQCAALLAGIGQIARVDAFLPAFEQALAANDAETLILLSKSASAQYSNDGVIDTLERAFNTVLPVLAFEKVEEAQRDEALKLALSLVPQLRETLGLAWIEQILQGDPQLGKTVLAVTGSSAAGSLQRHLQNPTSRLADLKVQKTVVETLLERAPERAAEWDHVLRLLALAWLREAELSRTLDQSTSFGPRMSRDMYGNLFYTGSSMSLDESGVMTSSSQRDQPRPISSADVLEQAPSESWLARLDDAVRPKFYALQAQLLLKVNDEDQAFPCIERLASSHPELTKSLVEEFVRVWTKNHDPNSNSASRYTSPYMLMYGFDVRAAGIPLTRSKQERNLEELAHWVARIRALPIEPLEDDLLAQAFTNCHSRAEVYRVEAIEEVFGSIRNLPSATLAALVSQMRANLGTVWRMPAEQEAAKTQRKQKDIEAEVLRGYAVARQLIDDGTTQHPDDWQLHLQQACLQLDEIHFRQEVAPSSEFSAQRAVAVSRFQHAAELYAAACPTLKEAEHTTQAFEHWFYAGLGASDVSQLDQKCVADPRQPPLIRAALLALPGEAAEKHLAKFANALFTRMSGLKPTSKFQYLQAGFEIVGDVKEAREARKLFDYYQDLAGEIKLVARLDGSARVGHSAPFGVFVDLLHTAEIERESGGFAKYLQNQNSMSYAYNYGRPLENYREKFETGVRAALEEHFDVQSVTFQEQDVHARAAAEYGWRVTPYAYLLLQPRGPAVDKLPALKLDLDFLDTTGYVALPVTSPQIFLDAAPSQGDRRPFGKLQVTQTLDERQAAEGKLVLEVRATSHGLVPALEELFDVRASDFEVATTEDEGVAVSKFNDESGDSVVVSERAWMIHYIGRKDLAELPREFRFPEPKVETAELSYLRYNDADLLPVEAVVTLEAQYGKVQTWRPWLVGTALAVLASAVLVIWQVRARHETIVPAAVALPETLTPFQALSLLRQVAERATLEPVAQTELSQQIAALEQHYFSGQNGSSSAAPDLRAVTERWLRRGPAGVWRGAISEKC